MGRSDVAVGRNRRCQFSIQASVAPAFSDHTVTQNWVPWRRPDIGRHLLSRHLDPRGKMEHKARQWLWQFLRNAGRFAEPLRCSMRLINAVNGVWKSAP